jgi:predicted RNA binding protein YcfA (HicA-like mRNA interferase family)
MGKLGKLFRQILTGGSDRNISFGDLRYLLLRFGFRERVKGSHHIYTKETIEEIINLQERNGMAKPYQVKQVRQILVKYRLEPSDE